MTSGDIEAQVREAIESGLVREVLADIELLRAADAETIAADPRVWSLRHDDFHSVDYMDDEEVRQSVIEDLLTVVDLRKQGKMITASPDFLVRFLGGERRERVIAAVLSDEVASYTVRGGEGEIDIDPEHLHAAMEYSGVFLDGWDLPLGVTALRAAF